MRTENTKKTPGAALLGAFAPCPVIHTFALAAALVIALHLLLRRDHDLMAHLSESFVRPVHAALARLNSHVPFSVAEALIAVAAAAVLARLLVGLVRLILRRSSARRAYRLFAGLLAFVLWVYAGFCVLWGTYYYGDDFSAKSGLESGPSPFLSLRRSRSILPRLPMSTARQCRAMKAAFIPATEAPFWRGQLRFLTAWRTRCPALTGRALRRSLSGFPA